MQGLLGLGHIGVAANGAQFEQSVARAHVFAVADVDSFNFGIFQRLDGFALSTRLGFALGDGDDIELPYPRPGKRKQGEEHDEPRRPFGRGADRGFGEFEVRRQKVALVAVTFGRGEFVAHGPDVASDGEVAFCQVAPCLFVDAHVCSFVLRSVLHGYSAWANPCFTPLDASPGFTPLDSNPGFIPLDSNPGFTPLDSNPGFIPLGGVRVYTSRGCDGATVQGFFSQGIRHRRTKMTLGGVQPAQQRMARAAGFKSV